MNIVAATESALAAGLLRFSTAADNIANVSTPGYTPRRVDLRTALSGGVEASVSAAAPALSTYNARGKVSVEPSSVDLAEEAMNLLSSEHDVKVSAAVLRRAHEMSGSLLDVLA